LLWANKIHKIGTPAQTVVNRCGKSFHKEEEGDDGGDAENEGVLLAVAPTLLPLRLPPRVEYELPGMDDDIKQASYRRQRRCASSGWLVGGLVVGLRGGGHTGRVANGRSREGEYTSRRASKQASRGVGAYSNKTNNTKKQSSVLFASLLWLPTANGRGSSTIPERIPRDWLIIVSLCMQASDCEVVSRCQLLFSAGVIFSFVVIIDTGARSNQERFPFTKDDIIIRVIFARRDFPLLLQSAEKT